ncbi:hypothetical protein [Massilia orientalis]|uniref:Uncharacterized protein n=1 Tax=Massilia orientalis TaxID=3050128 RepID=A0ACC7M8A9_9BURK|nr:hypothetical protein [Massilia sp. YIM B02787]
MQANPRILNVRKGAAEELQQWLLAANRPFNYEIMDSMSDSPDKKVSKFMGVGICFGVAIGCAIGVAIGNLALGIGPGVAIGVVIGALISKSRR